MKNKNMTSLLQDLVPRAALGLIALSLISACTSSKTKPESASATTETPVSNMRQFTFDGKRTGEGYFSQDGQLMIFQSERENDNPFYQIYIKDLKTGATHRVSPGYGKTTCSWLSPDKKWDIFSSTHLDPQAREKQKAEIDFRKSGQVRRYTWDYDENYDIFRTNTDGKKIINLTHTKGYDAEGSISPDGKLIAFASNRSAYEAPLSAKDAEILKNEPSYFMDIYIMNSDGTHVRRLTTSPGYDGGPFFSPNGKKIVWRRFSADGQKAEIYTMNIDGSDEHQVTKMGVMSWAPFFHPSGDYIIFTSNKLGYQNFELFIVDTEGRHEPVRVTYLDSFDGLPVFTPDGQKLTWNRKLSGTESQIMIADWSDATARKLLNLPAPVPSAKNMSPEITEADLKTVIRFLASKELRGRATGSEGEMTEMNAVEKYFHDLGLRPVNGNSYLQKFSFMKDAAMGSRNEVTLVSKTQQTLEINKSWRPMAFSKPGEVAASPIVFAGYGIRAPGEAKMPEYNSFAGLDVKDKWVMVLRYVPEDVPAERRLFLQRFSRLEHKASVARDLGARGIIFVNGPTSHAKENLLPFKRLSGANLGITAITVSDEIADQLLSTLQKNILDVQKSLDKELPFTAFEFPGLKLSANIDIRIIPGEGHNTLGLLKVPGATKTLIIGAHGDHLGDKPSDASLMTSEDKDPIHYGADDNASGVSAVLELADYFANAKATSSIKLKQNILFAVWSGEELGNLGSSYFVRNLKKMRIHPSEYINMDMIGRWKKNQANSYEPLAIQGIGSSSGWKETIETLQYNFPIQLQNDPYLPTDSMALYMGKIPTINFFTGAHKDYHTPRDTEDKINYEGLSRITKAVAKLATNLATTTTPLPYVDAPMTTRESHRGFRIFLGTIPDYTAEDVKGVKLSGVITGGPAEKAGLKGGDIIVEFSSNKIENIHDYVFALETIRPNEMTKVVVLRNGKREEINVVPVAKE